VRDRLGPAYLQAAQGQLAHWSADAEASLALVVLLDQVPRHLHRGSAEAFAADPLAREVAAIALARGQDLRLELQLQPFLYLPFEHHESAASQARAVQLFEAFVGRGGEESYLRYARLHADVIARFGRFPHRNAALRRTSTLEEDRYLASGGFKG
jgi:uncharacterized protein (DUF924 family)